MRRDGGLDFRDVDKMIQVARQRVLHVCVLGNLTLTVGRYELVEIGYTLLDYESLDAVRESCARAKCRRWTNASLGQKIASPCSGYFFGRKKK
jgi:hypothetical protein